ncbi:hypothetical protein BDZ94DRAFT_1303240 [Collybia nuda]|uniref:Uncharacterized protein n=1 Tax=Collybia nuda TaxID=64659 RepID=A0A9P5YJ23_9AGAR|nr:hypothetical protein BDZ94DRAFT_1303240 [Collybia nuda]
MPSVTPSHTSSKSKKSIKLDAAFASYFPSSSGREKPTTVPPLKTSDSKRESPRTPKSSPHSPQLPELPADTLKVIVGEKTRRSRCGPEFLEEVAKGGSFEVFEEKGRKFKIAMGPEAIGLYKRFLKGTAYGAELKEDSPDASPKDASPAIVFAVTVYDAGRKLVDYYMSWRGKTRARELRGSERRAEILDKEFRKVARSIDKEFKRTSIYGSSVGSVAGSARHSAKQSDTPESAPTRERPPSIIAPPPEAKVDLSTRPPLSATDSVMSLPFLNMIRGVPVGNRVPLRVTNPDRLSMISTSAASTTTETKAPAANLATVIEETETAVHVPTRTESTQSSRDSIRRTRSDHSEYLSKASSTSSASTASIYSTRKHKRDPDDEGSSEFLIVLLDDKIDKNSRTWHGLERQSSRSSARSTPTRVSPWDGPLARANGITYRSPPQRVAAAQAEESSSEEEWENSPVIPFKPYTTALGPLPPYQSPVIPPTLQYAPSPMVSIASLAHQSPYGSNPYMSSPYIPAYATSIHTPNTPMSRPLPHSTYTGYPSPYGPMPTLPNHYSEV